jgi:hypothetical protein
VNQGIQDGTNDGNLISEQRIMSDFRPRADQISYLRTVISSLTMPFQINCEETLGTEQDRHFSIVRSDKPTLSNRFNIQLLAGD